jgi:hypothetical protein
MTNNLRRNPIWLLRMRKHLNPVVICDYSRVKSSLTIGGLRRHTVGNKTLNGEPGVRYLCSLDEIHEIPEDHENKKIIPHFVVAACRFSRCGDLPVCTNSEHSRQANSAGSG